MEGPHPHSPPHPLAVHVLLRILLLSFVLLLPGRLSGQKPEWQALDPTTPLTELNVDLWTEDDGLPQNMASAIVQTPDGYLWLGTEEGLVRFDGVRFHLYGPEDSPAFTTRWVRALWADEDGTLWIGTGGGGLLRLRDHVFTAYTVEDGLPHDHVRTLFRDRSGTLWVGTNGGGVARLVEGGFEVLDTSEGLSSDFVFSIGQDRDGAIWIGTLTGLDRVASGEIRFFGREEGLASDRVNVVLGTSDGSLWAGTTDGGLSRFQDGSFTTWSTARGLASDYVTTLWEDPAGALWVGTNGGGIHRIHQERLGTLTTDQQLPGDLILAVAGDREGGLWLGMTGVGLGRLRDGMFRAIGRPEGLSSDIALALLEDRDGSMWIGTAGGGVNHLRDGEVRSFTRADGLGHDVVLSLARAVDGGVWVGMAAGGLSRIRNGGVETFGPEDGVASTQLPAVAQEDDGTLWLGTAGAGLQRWRPGPPLLYTTEDGLPGDHVTAILPTTDGALWVGTQDGLARLDEGTLTAVQLARSGSPSNSVTALHEADDGTLWVATKQGLGRVRDGDIAFYRPELGLFLEEIHGVVTDTLGHLWLSSNDGIARVRVADLEAVEDLEMAGGDAQGETGVDAGLPHRVFRRPDGLRSAEANGGVSPSAVRRADGTLWFPTMRGAVLVEPSDVTAERSSPAPVLEQVVVADSAIPASRTLGLPPGHRTLEFHFTAPTLVAPHEVAFRYTLEGFDETWVETGDRRVAYYTNLPPGPYRFRVATRRGDGAWSEAEADVELTLAPYFYETRLFRILAGLGLLALAWTAYRLRIRALTRREARLLALMEERERSEQALRKSEERLRTALEEGRKREEELRHAQKMEAVGRLAGGVAHDFNNLLTAISGRSTILLEVLPGDDDVREDLEEIQRAAGRAADLTQQLLTFSRRRIYQPRVLDLNDLIREVERLLRRLIREDILLETRLAPELGRVQGDPGAMEQILVNLVVNAQDAMPGGGRVIVETRNGTLPREEGDALDAGLPTHVVLSVIDEGEGIDPDTLEHVFDPFFTTKPAGKGTGLGLSTVYGIVQESDGEIGVRSRPGEGASFRIYLPLVREALMPRVRRQHEADTPGGSEAILLVEDDELVRSLTRKVLLRHGYAVRDTASPQEALESVRSDGPHVDLLISDVVMPGLSGRELAEQITALRPEVGVLLMSGYNEDEVLRRGVDGSGIEFLQKPFETTDLIRRVRRILDGTGGSSTPLPVP